MNRQQKNYALAKAHRETCGELLSDYEKDWIIRNGIKNPDGTIPTCVWTIDESLDFDAICVALESDEEYSRLYGDAQEAQKLLTAAEDALIDYGLSIAPASVREILDRNRNRLPTRKKLLDLAFRLDTRTVK